MARMLFLRDTDSDVQLRCRPCGHQGVLPHRDMVRRFGPDYPVLSIGPHYRCSRCGARDCESRLAPAEVLDLGFVGAGAEDDGAEMAASLAALRGLVDAARVGRPAAAPPEPEPDADETWYHGARRTPPVTEPRRPEAAAEPRWPEARRAVEPDDDDIELPAWRLSTPAVEPPPPSSGLDDAPEAEVDPDATWHPGASRPLPRVVERVDDDDDDGPPPAFAAFWAAKRQEDGDRWDDGAGADGAGTGLVGVEPADEEEEPSEADIASFAIRDPDRRSTPAPERPLERTAVRPPKPDPAALDDTMAALRAMIETAAAEPAAAPPPKAARPKAKAPPPAASEENFSSTLAKLRGLLDLDDPPERR